MLENSSSTTAHTRISIACEECRKKKRKCDGQKPSCTLCKRLSRPCVYVTETPSRKRKYWDEDYVHSLEDQILSLQNIIKSIQSGDSTSATDIVTTALDEIPKCHGSSSPNDSRHVLSSSSMDGEDRSDEALAELGSMVWKMSIGDGGEPAFAGPSGNFCFPGAEAAQSHAIRGEGRIDQDSHLSFATYSSDAALINHLRDCFFNLLNPYHQFTEVLAPDVFNQYPNEAIDLQFLHGAVLAAGSCVSNRPGSKLIGNTFATHAEMLALEVCRKTPSLAVVQGLTILAWRELSEGRDNTGWIYNSMAAGLAVHLGLHVIDFENLTDVTSLSTSNKSVSRIRTFWAFFLVDRMATSILGRYCTLPWRRVRVPDFASILPKDITVEEIAFDHQCKLWFVFDQSMDQIYSFEFSSLNIHQKSKLQVDAHEALISFHKGHDARLELASSNTNKSAFFFQISYQMSLQLIHRPFLHDPSTSSTFRLALRSMTAAAASMTRLIRTYQKIHTFSNAPAFLVHHILSAAVSHLLNATSSLESLRKQSMGRLRLCISALQELQMTWHNRALQAIQLVRMLAQRWKVVWALPISLSAPLDAQISGPVTSPPFAKTISNLANLETSLLSHPESAINASRSSSSQIDFAIENEIDMNGNWSFQDFEWSNNALEEYSYLQSPNDQGNLDWLFPGEYEY